ncbi:MAG: ABC transporter ATP-binding protein [Firmicutes bacterium]|nr:ABC transporter ATP-binding protein [Bacillota bacterium]
MTKIGRQSTESGIVSEVVSPLVLDVRDFSLTFTRNQKEIAALKQVNLCIKPNEILGLVGESGSGKSALGMAILGLHDMSKTATVGQILLNDTNVLKLNPKELKKLRKESLGIVFQDPMSSLNPSMKIGAQLLEVSKNADEALAMLDAVRIPNARDRMQAFPHELSGGLRQRVMIAMALLKNPKLIIADEPTTALDVTIQAQILRLIKELQIEFHTSWLFITHDLGVAYEIADRIAVLYLGQVMEVADSNQIIHHPSHPYTATLLNSRITIDADTTVAIPTMVETTRSAPQNIGCTFVGRCAYAQEICESKRPVDEGTEGHSVYCHLGSTDFMQIANSPEKIEQITPEYGAAILIENARKVFTKRIGLFKKSEMHALNGINLEISPGESIAIVGESGCGKSTLLRLIAGSYQLDSGSIQLNVRGGIQMIHQDAGSSLTPWLSVETILKERLITSGYPKHGIPKRILDLAQSIGLSKEILKAKPAQLSGGQKQRVAIARAIAKPPSILLCDEPTSALDVSIAAQVINLLRKLHSELKMTMLFVTHDLAVARLIGDRICVLHKGRIVEIGLSEEIVSNLRHPYTQLLISSIPGSRMSIHQNDFNSTDSKELRSGCSYVTNCPMAVDLCSKEMPQLVKISSQKPQRRNQVHLVRCHLVSASNSLGDADD